MNAIKIKPGSDSWLGVELRHLALSTRSRPRARSAARPASSVHAVGGQPAIATLSTSSARSSSSGGGPRRALTEAGQLPCARVIVSRLQARINLAALSAGEAGSPRGDLQSVGAKILPEVMRQFAGGASEGRHRGFASRLGQSADLVERGSSTSPFVQLPLDNPSLETVAVPRTTTSSSLPGLEPGRLRPVPTLREIVEQPLSGPQPRHRVVVRQPPPAAAALRVPHRRKRRAGPRGRGDRGCHPPRLGRPERRVGPDHRPRPAAPPSPDQDHGTRTATTPRRAFLATALEVGAETSASLAA